MKLTPMDINNKEFKKVLRGYKSEEVDEFLDEVVENYEEVFKENSRLKESLSRSTEQIEHYEKIENTIQNTLLLAQNAAEQARENTQKEADIILKSANDTAQKILDKSHSDVIQINDEYEKVKQEFIKFRAKFRNFMNTQTQTFNELERELTKNYNVSKPIEELELIEEKGIELSNSNIEYIKEEVYTDDMDEIKSFFAKK
ncbi:DivIVA domain-containing protein [Clostridium gasigenes]|uniref:Cell division initiation protein n=1 Tax=Clostridium gasigenes TaxID=94869 RepID=A0A1H0MVX8_9CLOT|nr:DivIVA domain-containing protein [Clostridium gasigenes]MBB6621815.1 DivIVA domain-containing protein [Clostridium gasigenes]MBB6716322.1 DivIVA domain-containing protein [Clostridium gasigenes]MBU3087349.1 DivIVA domain-containing protein [Clostridium gasigenes]MBU3102878.1 DivIVA domain-containing protein [Clostridium gasigenes]MBU3106588.1 DivIVA domain-containing protein [Clostridium gasigenes]